MTSHTEVPLDLTGVDGNAFALIAEGRKALRKHGVARDIQRTFVERAMASQSYDELLVLLDEWFEIEFDPTMDEI